MLLEIRICDRWPGEGFFFPPLGCISSCQERRFANPKFRSPSSQRSVLHQLDGSTDGYARYNRPWAQARSVAPALQDLPLEGNRGFISHLGGTYLPFGLLGRHCCFRAKACFIHATSQHAAPRHTLFIHKIEFEDFHVIRATPLMLTRRYIHKVRENVFIVATEDSLPLNAVIKHMVG